MCRIHIKTVREIRREEYLEQENLTPTLDFGGFIQWILDDLSGPWTPGTTVVLPLPLVLDGIMQPADGPLQPETTMGVNLFPLSAGLNGTIQQPELQTSASSHQSQGSNEGPSEQPQAGTVHYPHLVTMHPTGGGHSQQSHIGLNGFSQQPLPLGPSGFFYLLPGGPQESQTVNPGPLPPIIGELLQQLHTGTSELSQQSQSNLGGIMPGFGSMTEFLEQLQVGPSGVFQQSEGGSHGPSQQLFTSGLSVTETTADGLTQQLEASAIQQPQLQTSVSSHQSQVGNQGPSEQPETGTVHYPHLVTMHPAGGGHSQQSHTGTNGLSQQPLPLGPSGLFYLLPGGPQESQTVNPGPLPSVIGGLQQLHTGTSEFSQQSQSSLSGMLPGFGSTTEFHEQLQAGPSGVFQQSQGSGHGPSQQLFTSTSGLSITETTADGLTQQLEATLGGILSLFGWDGFLQQTHFGQGGLPGQTQGNNHGFLLHPQPTTNGPSQLLHGNMGGFSHQLQAGPSGSFVQSHIYNNASSLHPHPDTSVFSSQLQGSITGLLPFSVAMGGPSQLSEANNHESTQQSQAGMSTPSQPSEVHTGGHFHVPYTGAGLFCLPSFLGNGAIQGQAGMGGSPQQPANMDSLSQQSHVTTVGLSQQTQAGIGEIPQQPQTNTSEHSQHFQTDEDKLSEELQEGTCSLSEEFQANVK